MKQLRTANEVLRTASVFSPRRSSTAEGLDVDYIDRHREKFGVVPICRVLTEHGMPRPRSTPPCGGGRASPRRLQRRDEELCEHLVNRLPEASIQSPTRAVCSRVNGGSTNTASVLPNTIVDASGDHVIGSPLGSAPTAGIGSEMKTS